jgi:hypothetical protein
MVGIAHSIWKPSNCDDQHELHATMMNIDSERRFRDMLKVRDGFFWVFIQIFAIISIIYLP